MRFLHIAAAAAAIACAATTGGAFAHVTLEATEAGAGSTYKAVLRVPHGCDGSPTTAIRVKIPEGAIVAKPMPKAGWDLSTTEADYAAAYDYFGESITRGVTEIAWTGGSLPDAWYDEFVFRVRLPEGSAGDTVYFPVVQECESGVHRWIEIPEPGRSADDYEEPAPGVTLTAP
jgi:uncharacterized protein YcnI